MTNFDTGFADLWHRRRCGDYEGTLAEWRNLKQSLALPLAENAADEYEAARRAGSDRAAATDFVTLGISFLSRAGEIDAADTRLGELESHLRENGVAETFQLAFSRGLLCLYRGDYVFAAAKFAAAGRLANTKLEICY